MIKYKPDTVSVVFNEIPDEVTLAIEITNCPGHCEGCHSPWLREDIGEELTPETLRRLIDENRGVTCVCLMGEGKDPEALKYLALSIRTRSDYPYKTALYSGRNEVEKEYDTYFDYIKVGPYIPKYGPLNKETTNQRLYMLEHQGDGNYWQTDITQLFWRNHETSKIQ
jgi:anaerobic ribonucleoside-triphosphate reductase activating protein